MRAIEADKRSIEAELELLKAKLRSEDELSEQVKQQQKEIREYESTNETLAKKIRELTKEIEIVREEAIQAG